MDEQLKSRFEQVLQHYADVLRERDDALLREKKAPVIGFANIIAGATERHDAQEKLVEAREQLALAQKMEAIGKLTGGHRARLQ
jgi:hypothetical protein